MCNLWRFKFEENFRFILAPPPPQFDDVTNFAIVNKICVILVLIAVGSGYIV